VTILWVVLVLLAFVAWLILIFNRLVSLSNTADAAWADIDAQLKRRYDLVPNLLELAKGYAAHEGATFEKIAAARTAGLDAFTPGEKAQTEPGLAAGLRSVFALAESYPELKANEQFLNLQHTLTDIEDYLQTARRHYNAVVRELNTQAQVFPNNLFASLFGIVPREYFQFDSGKDGKVARTTRETGASTTAES
jgi:LemA protein